MGISGEALEKVKRVSSESNTVYTSRKVQQVWRSYYTWKCLGYFTRLQVDQKVAKDTKLTIGQVRYIKEHYKPNIGEINEFYRES